MCYAVFSRSEVNRHVYLLGISCFPSSTRCCFLYSAHFLPVTFSLTVISSSLRFPRYISSPVFPVRHGIERGVFLGLFGRRYSFCCFVSFSGGFGYDCFWTRDTGFVF